MASPPERSVRVSTLELFFDLVFVFTITQLTGVLVAGGDAAAIAQVVVMLLLIWWMYDGYAWLTNAITTDRCATGSCWLAEWAVSSSSRSLFRMRTTETGSRSGSDSSP